MGSAADVGGPGCRAHNPKVEGSNPSPATIESAGHKGSRATGAPSACPQWHRFGIELLRDTATIAPLCPSRCRGAACTVGGRCRGCCGGRGRRGRRLLPPAGTTGEEHGGMGDLRPGHRNCAHRRHLGRGGHGFAGGNAGRLTSGETASDARLPTDHARLHPGLPRSSSRSPSKTGRQRRRRAVPLHRGGVSAAGRRTGRAVDRDLGGVGRPAPGRTGDVDGATKGLDAVAEPNES
ncbi:MAG: hypothetical protein QOG64_608 [Acidimicrobiaceae bacterium]|jgi:hypothetical protein|nr:hypothetical protein [Acidimicrobiaceae bacterium]